MGTVSIDKDTYLTPTPLLRQTRAPNNSQYHRYPAYTDAHKKKQKKKQQLFSSQNYSTVE